MTNLADENAIHDVVMTKETEAQERLGVSFSMKEITLRYGGIRAIEALTIEARPGDTIGIFGNSGSGKTTVCNILCGLEKPEKGKVTINGKKATRRSPLWHARQGLRRTFEDPVYFDTLTLEENVLIGSPSFMGEGLVSALFTPRLFLSERKETARRILEYCHVDPNDANKMVRLDRSTQARVELARALMGNPRILVLDEPTRSMDDDESAQYFQVVADYIETFSTTLVLVENDIDVVQSLCKRAIALDAGEFLAEGEVVPVVRNDTVKQRFFSSEVRI